MGVKVFFDTANRLMIVTEAPVIPAGAVIAQQTLDIEIDFYSDAKEDWNTNVGGDFRRNRFPFLTAESAGSPLPGGQVEPAFFRLRNDDGWRILPFDSDHELTLLGNIVPADETLPIFASRAGRSILVFRDGSQVAQMTSTTVIEAVSATPEIQNIDSKTDLIAFLDGVAIDTVNGFAGTGLNVNGDQIGTRLAPSDNLADTKTIADNFGLGTIYVINHLSLVTGDFSDGYVFIGDSQFTIFSIGLAVNTANCSFRNLTPLGEFGNSVGVLNSSILGASKIGGVVSESNLSGTISISLSLEVNRSGASSGVIFDMSRPISTLVAMGFRGNAEFENISTNDHFFDSASGLITVGASCIGGTLTITGQPYEIIDNSTGTTVIDLTGDTKTRSTNTIAQQDTLILEEVHGQVSRSVWIDTEAVTNGNGYQQDPFNNFTDAVDYAEANGLTNLHVLADATVDRQLKNFIITGVGTPVIDTNGQNLDRSEILRCGLTGSYTGRIIAQECNVVGVFTLNGFFENCAFSSNLVVPDGGLALMKDCDAFVTGATPPEIDIGGVAGTAQLVVTGYDGGMRIVNVNQVTDDVKFLTNVGRVIIDASCTLAGNINVGGVTVLNNFGTGTPNDQTLDPNHLHDIWHFRGLDGNNPVDITGDGVTESVLDVAGKQLTITPNSLTRTG